MLATLLAATPGLVLPPARGYSRLATAHHQRVSVPRLALSDATADDERRERLEELERLAAELSEAGTDTSAITDMIAELRAMPEPTEVPRSTEDEVPPLDDGEVPPPPPLDDDDGEVPPPPQGPPAGGDIFSRRPPERGAWSADEDVAADAGDALEEKTRRILSDAAARRESDAAAAAAAAASAPPPPPAAPAKSSGVKTWKGEDLDAAIAARAARDAAAAAAREEAEAALLAKTARLAEMEKLAAELSAGGADTSAIADTIAALRASLEVSEREAAALAAPPPPPPPPPFATPPPTRTLTDDEINEELRRRLGVGESPRAGGATRPPSPPAASGGMGYMRRNENPASAENLEQWLARVADQMRPTDDDGRDRDGDGRTVAEIEEARAAAAQRSAKALAEATSGAERFCLQKEEERTAEYGRAGEGRRAKLLSELEQYYVAPLRVALSEASLLGVAQELLPRARQTLAELDAMVERMREGAPPPEPGADGPFGFLKRR